MRQYEGAGRRRQGLYLGDQQSLPILFIFAYVMVLFPIIGDVFSDHEMDGIA